MAYATKADLQQRLTDTKLVQLTDFGNTGSMDEARITEALNVASALVDSYVAGRYTLPLTVSDQVRDLTVELAVYKLHAARQAVPEQVRADHDRILSFLKDVGAGRASLDQSAKLQASELDAKTKDHDAKPDVFDTDKLDAY